MVRRTKSKGKKSFNPIGFKTWKDGHKRVEFRLPNGRVIQRRKVAGSGMTSIKEFAAIFKQNNTFYENRKRTKLGSGTPKNFYENVYTTDAGKKIDYDFKVTDAERKAIKRRIKNNEEVSVAERKIAKQINPQFSKSIKKPRAGRKRVLQADGTYKVKVSQGLYVVSGVFKGKRYYGRSTIKGTEVAGLTVNTSAEAKKMAWDNLLGLIAMQSEGYTSGDSVFGYEQIQEYGITDIREEWVFYN